MEKHTSGSGAGAGIDFTIARQFYSKLREDGAHSGDATLSLMVMAGVGWPMASKMEAHLSETDVCPRCGTARETDTHRFGQCEASLFVKDVAVAVSQNWSGKAEAVMDHQILESWFGAALLA